MANFKAYCDWMLTLSSLRVVVIDTFNNPLLLDASSGSNLTNVPGTEVDGLHPGAVGGYELGSIIAPQIASRIDTSVNYAPLPTGATTGNYINPNPLFSGTAGTKSGIVTGTVPNNTTVTCAGVTGMTVVASIEAMPNGEGNAVVLTVAGTASAAGAIIVSQTVPAASITMGTDKIRFVANAYYTIDPGSLFNTAGFVCFMTPTPSTYAQTISGLAVTSQTNNYLRNEIDASHGYLPCTAPVMDFTTSGAATAATMTMRWNIGFKAGPVSGVFKVGQFGAFKSALG
jgi:hypothetical protein